MTDTEFKMFRCWDPARVTEVIKIDAAALAPEVLLAVHQPGRAEISPGVPQQGTQSKRTFSDEDVLTRLLDPAHRMMIVPVIGDSGAGKSHLVQWLHARVQGTPKSHIIYVPRHLTGLRGLLESVIDGLSGAGIDGEVAELRDQMQRAYGELNTAELPQRLINAMGLYLTSQSPTGDESTRDRQRREHLCQSLNVLLLDPTSRGWFLRRESAIARFVAQHEAAFDAQQDREARFSPDEIPVVTSFDVHALGAPAREAIQVLNLTIPGAVPNRDRATHLLNEALVASIPEVFGLRGTHTLGSVLRAARKLLFSRGEQLIVFVEDLTRFHGVERDLIDAFIDPVEENGVQVQCDLRVAIAVTTGYFRVLPEGFRTRCNVFDLNEGLEDPESQPTRTENMVARYLRAIRIDSNELKSAHESATDDLRRDGSWVPNRCTDGDGCQFREECHGTFGEVDGIGLYPFNRAALSAMSQSAFLEDNGNGRFNPRHLLWRVVVRTLESQSSREFVSSGFPSERLESLFTEAPALPAAARLDLERDPGGTRARVLARFWGGGTAHAMTDAVVRAAFGIPTAGTAPRPVDPPRTTPVVPAKPDPTLDNVAAWASGQPMELPAAEGLRSTIFDAVRRIVHWSVLGLKPDQEYMVGVEREGLSHVLRKFSFSFEDQVDDPKLGQTLVERRFHRTDSNTVIRLDMSRAARSALGTDLDAYCEVQDLIEEIANEVSDQIASILWEDDSTRPVQVLVGRLTACGLVAGSCQSTSDVSLAAEVLSSPRALGPVGLTVEWQQARTDLLEMRAELAAVLIDLCSYRQGSSGSVTIIRTGRVLHHLRRFLDGWEFAPGRGRTADFGLPRLANSLQPVTRRMLDVAASSEMTAISSRLAAGVSLLGTGVDDVVALCDAASDAFDRAFRHGVNFGNVNDTQRAMDQLRGTNLVTAPALPGDDEPLQVRLQWCAAVIGSGILELHLFIDRLSTAIETGIEAATAGIGAIGTGGAGPAVLAAELAAALKVTKEAL